MRVVNFRDDVLYPMADLLGIDWAQDLTRDHARSWASFINARVRQAWEAWDWRELNVTEERAFRQVWASTEQYNRQNSSTTLPDELYYATNSTYYQVWPGAASDPPIGTLPTDTNFFLPLALATVTRVIDLDQRGRMSIGQVEGIYASDPRIPGARPRRFPHSFNEQGITVSDMAGPTVWMTFKRPPSKFSTLPYSATATYKPGQVVYWTDGQCYRATGNLDPGTADPTDAGSWALVPMPYTISEYVKFAAASDAADDATQQQNYLASAGNALQREIDKLVEQGQVFPRYRAPSLGGRRGIRPLIAYVNTPVPVI